MAKSTGLSGGNRFDDDGMSRLERMGELLLEISKQKYKVKVDTDDLDKAQKKSEKLTETIAEQNKAIGKAGQIKYFATQEEMVRQLTQAWIGLNKAQSAGEKKDQKNTIMRWANAYRAMGYDEKKIDKKILKTADEQYASYNNPKPNGDIYNSQSTYSVEEFKKVFDQALEQGIDINAATEHWARRNKGKISKAIIEETKKQLGEVEEGSVKISLDEMLDIQVGQGKNKTLRDKIDRVKQTVVDLYNKVFDEYGNENNLGSKQTEKYIESFLQWEAYLNKMGKTIPKKYKELFDKIHEHSNVEKSTLNSLKGKTAEPTAIANEEFEKSKQAVEKARRKAKREGKEYQPPVRQENPSSPSSSAKQTEQRAKESVETMRETEEAAEKSGMAAQQAGEKAAAGAKKATEELTKQKKAQEAVRDASKLSEQSSSISTEQTEKKTEALKGQAKAQEEVNKQEKENPSEQSSKPTETKAKTIKEQYEDTIKLIHQLEAKQAQLLGKHEATDNAYTKALEAKRRADAKGGDFEKGLSTKDDFIRVIKDSIKEKNYDKAAAYLGLGTEVGKQNNFKMPLLSTIRKDGSKHILNEELMSRYNEMKDEANVNLGEVNRELNEINQRLLVERENAKNLKMQLLPEEGNEEAPVGDGKATKTSTSAQKPEWQNGLDDKEIKAVEVYIKRLKTLRKEAYDESQALEEALNLLDKFKSKDVAGILGTGSFKAKNSPESLMLAEMTGMPVNQKDLRNQAIRSINPEVYDQLVPQGVQGTEQALADVAEQEQIVSDKAKELANTITKDFGIKGKEAIQSIAIEIDKIIESASKGETISFDNMISKLSEYYKLTKDEKGDLTGQYDQLRAFISKSKIHKDSEMQAEFGDDWNLVRNTIGSRVVSATGGSDIMTVLREANDALGTTFDLTTSNADAWRQLYEALQHPPKLDVFNIFRDLKTSESVSVINMITDSLREFGYEVKRTGVAVDNDGFAIPTGGDEFDDDFFGESTKQSEEFRESEEQASGVIDRNNQSLKERIEYLKQIKAESKFLETAEERKSDMEDKAWDAGGNNPRATEAQSQSLISKYESHVERMESANALIDGFEDEYEQVIITMKNGEEIAVQYASDLEDVSLAANKIADIKFIPFSDASDSPVQDLEEFDRQISEVEFKTRQMVETLAKIYAEPISSSGSEDYYKNLYVQIENIGQAAAELKSSLFEMDIPETATNLIGRRDKITNQFAWIDQMVASQKGRVQEIYDSIDFEAQKAAEEFERKISARQQDITQRILGNADFKKYGEQGWMTEYINLARTDSREIDEIYSELEAKLAERKKNILEAEAREEKKIENRNQFQSFLRGVSPEGSEEYGRKFAQYSELFNSITDDVNTLDAAIQRVKDDMASVENPKYLNTAPEGWKKLEGSLTAPQGYEWWTNGASRFSSEYQAVLVKVREATQETKDTIVRSQEEIQAEIEETNGIIKNQENWMRYLGDPNAAATSTGKRDATDHLRNATNRLVNYRMHPEQFYGQLDEEKITVGWWKAMQEAKSQGVADSVLSRYNTDISQFDYEEALSRLNESLASHKNTLQESKDKLAQLQAELQQSISKVGPGESQILSGTTALPEQEQAAGQAGQQMGEQIADGANTANTSLQVTEESLNRIISLAKEFQTGLKIKDAFNFATGDMAADIFDPKKFLQPLVNNETWMRNYIERTLKKGGYTQLNQMLTAQQMWGGESDPESAAFADVNTKVGKQKAALFGSIINEYTTQWEQVSDRLQTIRTDIVNIIQGIADSMNIKIDSEKLFDGLFSGLKDVTKDKENTLQWISNTIDKVKLSNETPGSSGTSVTSSPIEEQHKEEVRAADEAASAEEKLKQKREEAANAGNAAGFSPAAEQHREEAKAAEDAAKAEEEKARARRNSSAETSKTDAQAESDKKAAEAARDTAKAGKEAESGINAEGNAAKSAKKNKDDMTRANQNLADSMRETGKAGKEAASGVEAEQDATDDKKHIHGTPLSSSDGNKRLIKEAWRGDSVITAAYELSKGLTQTERWVYQEGDTPGDGDWILQQTDEVADYNTLLKDTLNLTKQLALAEANLKLQQKKGAGKDVTNAIAEQIKYFKGRIADNNKLANEYEQRSAVPENGYTKKQYDADVVEQTKQIYLNIAEKSARELETEIQRQQRTIDQANSWVSHQLVAVRKEQDKFDYELNPEASKGIKEKADLKIFQTEVEDLINTLNGMKGKKLDPAAMDNITESIAALKRLGDNLFSKGKAATGDLKKQDIGFQKAVLGSRIDAFVASAQRSKGDTTSLITDAQNLKTTMQSLQSGQAVTDAFGKLKELRAQLQAINEEYKTLQETAFGKFDAVFDAKSKVNMAEAAQTTSGETPTTVKNMAQAMQDLKEAEDAASDAYIHLIELWDSGQITTEQFQEAYMRYESVEQSDGSQASVNAKQTAEAQAHKKAVDALAESYQALYSIRTKLNDSAQKNGGLVDSKIQKEYEDAIAENQRLQDELKGKLSPQEEKYLAGVQSGVANRERYDKNISAIATVGQARTELLNLQTKQLNGQTVGAEELAAALQNVEEKAQAAGRALVDLALMRLSGQGVNNDLYNNIFEWSQSDEILKGSEKAREAKDAARAKLVDKLAQSYERLAAAEEKAAHGADAVAKFHGQTDANNIKAWQTRTMGILGDEAGWSDEEKTLIANARQYRTDLQSKYDETRGVLNSKALGFDAANAERTWDTLINRAQQYQNILNKQRSGKSLTVNEYKFLSDLGVLYDKAGEKAEEAGEKGQKFNEVMDQAKANVRNQVIDSYSSAIGSLDRAGDGKPEEYNRQVQTLQANLEKLKNLDLGSTDWISTIKELDAGIKTLNTDLNTQPVNDNLKESLNRQMSEWISKNGRAGEYAQQVRLLQDELSNVTNRGDQERIAQGFERIKASAAEAGKVGQTFGEGLIKRFKSLGQYLLSFASFYRIIGTMRQAVNIVKELDTGLMEVRKVSSESLSSLKQWQQTTFDQADKVGGTASQIESSTAAWMRLGKSFTEAQEAAQASVELLNVSEFTNIDDATTSLVSMRQAFDDLTYEDFVDKLNAVGDNFSSSTDQLSQGMQNISAVLKASGNDIDQSLALLTAANNVTQDISKSSMGVRTIALRIAGTEEAKQELEELGEDVSDFVVQTQSKVDAQVRKFTATEKNPNGISVLDSDGRLRNTYDVLLDIAEVYEDILAKDEKYGTNTSNALLELLAGKTRSNILASILQSPDVLREAYETSQNAAGTGQRELDIYLDSVEAKLQKLQNRIQQLASTVVSSEFIKTIVDGLSKAVELASVLIDQLGTLPTLLGTIGGFFLQRGGFGLLNFDKMTRTWNPGKFGKALSSFLGRAFTKVTVNPDVSKFFAGHNLNETLFGSEDSLMAINGLRSAPQVLQDYTNSAIAAGRQSVTLGEALRETGTQVTGFTGLVSNLGNVATSVFSTLATMGISMLVMFAIQKVAEGIHYLATAEKRLLEAGETAQKNIDEARSKLEEPRQFQEESTERFVELHSKVDPKTNKNISLTNQEYEEYLSLSDQVAKIYPSVVESYDSQGHAILNLSSNITEATGQMKEWLATEEAVAGIAISDNIDDSVTATITKYEKYKEEIDENSEDINDNKKASSYLLPGVSVSAEDVLNDGGFKMRFSTNPKDIGDLQDSFRSAMSGIGIDEVGDYRFDLLNSDPESRTLDFVINFEQSGLDKIQKSTGEFISAMKTVGFELGGKLSQKTSELELKNASIVKEAEALWDAESRNIVDSFTSNPNYQMLSETVRSQLYDVISSVDPLQIKKEKPDDVDWNDYIRSTYLYPITDILALAEQVGDDADEELKNAAKAITGIFEIDSSMSTSKYQAKLDSYLDTLHNFWMSVMPSDQDEDGVIDGESYFEDFIQKYLIGTIDDGEIKTNIESTIDKIMGYLDTSNLVSRKAKVATEQRLSDYIQKLSVSQLQGVLDLLEDNSFVGNVFDAIDQVLARPKVSKVNDGTLKGILSKDDYKDVADAQSSNLSTLSSSLETLRTQGSLTAEEMEKLQEAIPDLTEFTEQALTERGIKSLSSWIKELRKGYEELGSEGKKQVDTYSNNIIAANSMVIASEKDARTAIYGSLFDAKSTDTMKQEQAEYIEGLIESLEGQYGEDLDWNIVWQLAVNDQLSGDLNEIYKNYDNRTVWWNLKVEIPKEIENLQRGIDARASQRSALESQNTYRTNSGLESSDNYWGRIIGVDEQNITDAGRQTRLAKRKYDVEGGAENYSNYQKYLQEYYSALDQRLQDQIAADEDYVKKVAGDYDKAGQEAEYFQSVINDAKDQGQRASQEAYQSLADSYRTQAEQMRTAAEGYMAIYNDESLNTERRYAALEKANQLSSSALSAEQSADETGRGWYTDELTEQQQRYNDLQTEATEIEQKITKAETNHQKVSDKRYEELIKNGDKQIQNLKVQKTTLTALRDATKVGTDAWRDYQSQIDSVDSSILEMQNNQTGWFETMTSVISTNAQTLASTLGSAFSEIMTGTGLTIDTMNTLKQQFSDLTGMDVSNIFYESADGMKLNFRAAEALVDAEYALQTTNLRDEITRQNDVINRNKDLNTEAARAAVQAANDKIDAANRELSMYQALYDQQKDYFTRYQAFQRAQSSENAGSRYEEMQGYWKTAQENFNKGLTGTDEFRAYVQYFDQWGQDTVEAYKRNKDRISRYMTEDFSGLRNFLNDLVAKGYATTDGNAYSYAIENVEQTAADMGMSVEWLRDVLGRLEDYGFTNNWVESELDGREKIRAKTQELMEAQLQYNQMSRDGASADVLANQEEVMNRLRFDIESLEAGVESVKSRTGKITSEEIRSAINDIDMLRDTFITEDMDDGTRRTVENYIKALAEENHIPLKANLEIDTDALQQQFEGFTAEIKYEFKEGQEYNKELVTDEATYSSGKEKLLGLNLEDESVIDDLNTINELTKEQFETIKTNDGQWDSTYGEAEHALGRLAEKVGLTKEEIAQIIPMLEELGLIGGEETYELQSSEEGETPQHKQKLTGLLRNEAAYYEAQEAAAAEEERWQGINDNAKPIVDAIDIGVKDQIIDLNSTVSQGFSDVISAIKGEPTEAEKAAQEAESSMHMMLKDMEYRNKQLSIHSSEAQGGMIDYEKQQRVNIPQKRPDTGLTNVLSNELLQGVEYRLSQLGKGGNVDLLRRPVIDTKFLNEAGYDAGNGAATVYSYTGTNEDKTVAVNFTPIIVDENGNYAGVLSPGDMQSYAEEVIAGVRNDDLHLQIGTSFEGKDAVQQAELAADEIHQLHEQYYADEIAKTGWVPVDEVIKNYQSQNMAEKAAHYYEELLQPKEETSNPWSSNIISDEKTQEITGVITEVDDTQLQEEDATIDVTPKVDTSGVQEDLNNNQYTLPPLQLFGSTDQPNSETTASMNTTQASESISKVQQEGEAYAEEEYSSTLSANDQASTIINNVEAEAKALDGTQSTVYANADATQAKEEIRLLREQQSQTPIVIPVRTSSPGVPTAFGWQKKTKLTGTMLAPAHVSGTAYNVLNAIPITGAFADGKVGLEHDEEALVNELGTESLIRDGKWFLIPGGMHTENLKKGDVVLNHTQTADLVKSGKAAGHGKAYAQGSGVPLAAIHMMAAHYEGQTPANYAGGSGNTPYVNSSVTAVNKNTNAIKDNTKASKDGKDSTDKAKTALDKFNEWLGKFVDWIDNRIDTLTTRIERFEKKAEQAISYGGKNTNIQKAMNTLSTIAQFQKGELKTKTVTGTNGVTAQIATGTKNAKKGTLLGDTMRGAVRYQKQADKVMRKAVKSGLLSQKKANEITKLIQTGEIDIRKYNEKVRAVISAYEDWFGKSQDLIDSTYDLKQQFKDLEQTKLDNITERFETLVGLFEATNAASEATVDYYTTRGEAVNTSDRTEMTGQLGRQKNITTELGKELKAYQDEMKQAAEIFGKESNEYREAQTQEQEIRKALKESQTAELELTHAIEELRFTVRGYVIDRIEAFVNKLSGIAGLAEKRGTNPALGYKVTEDVYAEQTKYNNDLIEKYYEDLQDRRSEIARRMVEEGLKINSDAYQELYNKVVADEEALLKLYSANEDLKNSIRTLRWKEYKEFQETLDKIDADMKHIQSFIREGELLDEDGQFTARAFAQIALIGEQMDVAEKKIANARVAIEKLNAELANGTINQETFGEEFEQQLKIIQDAASEAYDDMQKLADMYIKQITEENSILQDLISKRKEALSAKKSYYDYDKQIREKNKDVNALRAQVNALNGVKDCPYLLNCWNTLRGLQATTWG